MRAFVRISAGAALTAAAGCGPASVERGAGDPGGGAPGQGSTQGGAERVAEASGADTVANGLHLNGLHLNGIHLNGMSLDGVPLDGLLLDGSLLNHVTLAGAVLSAVRPDGQIVSGAGLVGAQLAATAGGTPLTLRLDAVTPTPEPDVLLYDVSYRAAGTAAFLPLCGRVAGAPVKALALRGTWDESEGTPTGGSRRDDATAFTFACQGYALAKCVDLGYAPWRTVTECRAAGDCRPLSLAPVHQACTRMLRADYCGDGTATTRDGTLVDVWDGVALQTDDAPSWTFEAEWTAGGASCVLATRWPTIVDEDVAVTTYLQQHCPGRWQAPGCGGPASTFFPASGFSVPPAQRSVLRTRINSGT
jgi:hypothetical protein